MDKLTKNPKGGEKNAAVGKLVELIGDIEVAMLTTLEDDGSMRSRPMMTQDTAFDGALWFFTAAHDGKAEDLARDPRVNLAYAAPEKQKYVSVSGLAETVEDEAKKKELWKEIYRAWFPKGIDDPELALLKVYVDKAEYWDAPSSRFVEIVGFTKAVLTGKRYQPEDVHDQIVFDAKAQKTSTGTGDGARSGVSRQSGL